MKDKKFEAMVNEINNREQDETGSIRISVSEFLEMKKRDYKRPEDIEMYIISLDESEEK